MHQTPPHIKSFPAHLVPLLRPLLRDALPDADLERVGHLGEGWNGVAYRVPEAPGAAAGETGWVVRVPKLAWAEGEIERQTCLYPRLLSRGLPVPRSASLLRGPDGRVACGLYRYVEGAPASIARMPLGRALLAREVADFLTALHAVPLEEATACGVETIDAWPERYEPLVRYWSPRLRGRSSAWLEATGERLGHLSLSAPPRVLLHGDLEPNHLLLAEDGSLRGVIDFAGPLVADPAIDFGRLVQHFGAPFAERVLREYRGETDAHFPERMRLYAALQPLITVETGRVRDLPEALTQGRRQIAARAAAASRGTS